MIPRPAIALLLASIFKTAIPSPLDSASRLTLLPTIADEYDGLASEQLQPKTTITLSYSAEEDDKARVDTIVETKYSTVVLERSAYVQAVTCHGNVISIIFDREPALAAALRWSTSNLALITNHASCYDDHGQHGIHIVTRIRPSDHNVLQLDVEARRATMEEFADTMELQYKLQNPQTAEDTHSQELRKRYVSPCSVTPVAKPQKQAICKAEGFALRPSIRKTFYVGKKELALCATRCHKDPACKSFSHGSWNGYCTLYGKAMCDQKHRKLKSGLVFYDRGCYTSSGACGATQSSTTKVAGIRTTSSTTKSSTVAGTLSSTMTIRSSSSVSQSSFSSSTTSSKVDVLPALSSSTTSRTTQKSVETTTSRMSTTSSFTAPSSLSTTSTSSPTASSSLSTTSTRSSIAAVQPTSSTTISISAATSSISTSSSIQSASFVSSTSSLTSTSSTISSSANATPSPTTSTTVSSAASSPSTTSMSTITSSTMTPSSTTASDNGKFTAATEGPLATLSPIAQYFYLLFEDGLNFADDGETILLDLDDEKVLTPTYGAVTTFTPGSRQALDAGIDSLNSLYTIAAQGLAQAAKVEYTGTPDNVKETLPDGLTVIKRLKSKRYAPNQGGNVTTDVVIWERSLGLHRRGFFDLFGGLIHKVVGAFIGHICEPCGQVYGYLTDPLSLVAEVCQPCKPVIDLYGRITDPFGSAFDAIRELWEKGFESQPKAGSFRPPGSPPKPASVGRPRQPLYFEGTQSVRTSWSSGDLTQQDFINFRGTQLKCHHCSRQMSALYLQATMVLSFASKSISKAQFDLDMDYQSQYTLSFSTQGSPQRQQGSRGFRQQGISHISLGPMLVSLIYEETLAYDIYSPRAVPETLFRLESQFNPVAKFDARRDMIQEARDFQIIQEVDYPSIPYAAQLEISLSTIAAVKIGVEFFGNTWYPETILTSTTSVAFSSKTNPAGDFTCSAGDTQFDVFINSETSLLRQTQWSPNRPLGRRCLNLPTVGALELWCGGGVEKAGANKVGEYNWLVACSGYASNSENGPLGDHRTDSFAACMELCNTDVRCGTVMFNKYPGTGANCQTFVEVSDFDQGEYNLDTVTGNKISGPGFPVPPPPPPPPPPSPSIPPTPLALPSPETRPEPDKPRSTLPPVRSFVRPANQPAPPVPAGYPPRNPYGWCEGYEDGLFNYIRDPENTDKAKTVAFDIQCGTTMDYTGIAIGVPYSQSFEDCMRACTISFFGCKGIVWTADHGSPQCAMLAELTGQRYTGTEAIFAYKGPQDW